jgi:hypothetical protein
MKNVLLLVCFFMLNFYFVKGQSITAHEWGTFTARFTDLGLPYYNMHQRVEEPLPNFVEGLDFNSNYFDSLITQPGKAWSGLAFGKELTIFNTTIKMETPVVYFYSKDAVNDLLVDVKFNKGSISQFYPKPFDYEDSNFVKRQIKYQPPSCASCPGKLALNFNEYKGKASWQIAILNDMDINNCSENDPKLPKVWTAPRQTQSNLITCNGTKEKFIFYRGLGGFDNPITLKYTQNYNLKIENKLNLPITYVLAIETLDDGSYSIWDTIKLDANSTRIIRNKKIRLTKLEWELGYWKDFLKHLIDDGLYEDEARAILETWKESYFDTKGLKVFYLVPRNFTDSILPINFSKPISDLQRVMIGRAEIDALVESNKLQYALDTSVEMSDNLEQNECGIKIFPNPSNGALFIISNEVKTINAICNLFSADGRSVFCSKIILNPNTKHVLTAKDFNLPSGNYTLVVSYDKRITKHQIIIDKM